MPNSNHKKIVSTDEVDVGQSIKRAWRKREYRPTVVLIGTVNISDGVYGVPLVNYDNAPGNLLIPPQRMIARDETVHTAAWALLHDGFVLNLPPRFSQPKVVCHGYYDHAMSSDRRPEGFSVGKRYYFGEVSLDHVALTVKKTVEQRDPNPIVCATVMRDLGEINGAFEEIVDESKRLAWIEAVAGALTRRFNREYKSAAA